jgi:hypothetical protein
MKYLIVRWNPNHSQDNSWHEEREDNSYEREYIKDKGTCEKMTAKRSGEQS